MAFLRRRLFSTTIFRRVNLAHYEGPGPTRATPSPTNMDPLLNSPELQQLGKKAKGPWKEFSKEEAVKLYRATFPHTFKETKETGSGHYRTVVPIVVGLCTFAYFLNVFLRDNFGPEKPHTYQNPEWEEASRLRNIENKINPIAGVSYKYAKREA